MSPLLLLALVVNYALAGVCVVRVLRRRREPTAMVAWIFAVVTIPVLGIVFYWVLSSDRLRRKAGRRRRRVAHLLGKLKHWTHEQAGVRDEPARPELASDLEGIARLGRRLADMPAIGGNAVDILLEAEATYGALEEAILAAQRHVHMEYYIWRADETGRRFREALIDRARAGVECRLLLDAVGCWGLGRSFIRPLIEAGVQVAFFLPPRPLPLRKKWSMHLRNHRKVVVVDGQVAFTGSQNIGDEYRGRRRHLSPWHDAHMRLSGPAALFLQQTFAEDWYLATDERLDSERCFPRPVRAGDSVVQVLPTGPDHSANVLGQILFAAVSSARSSIRISTPYFVPDPAVRMALAHACYRGVDVTLVLPSRSDSVLSLWAGRSYYAELLEAGVEIHEYDAGVLHSKVITVDDRWCMLGSANVDVRSFKLNFEITALIYDQGLVTELAESIDGFCARARSIPPHEVWHRGGLRRLGEGAARLLTPLL